MNHHKWNNDRKVEGGTTRDWSSIFRYGSGDSAEHPLAYTILGFARADFGALIEAARKHRDGARVALEGALVVRSSCFLLSTSWRGFLVFYVPGWYLGWSLSCLENYYEHWAPSPAIAPRTRSRATTRSTTSSRSTNGFHQEHQLPPADSLGPEWRRCAPSSASCSSEAAPR